MDVQEQLELKKKPPLLGGISSYHCQSFFIFSLNWGSINLYFMWTSHIPAYSSRALFFHSESLLGHTLKKQDTMKKKRERKKKINPGGNDTTLTVAKSAGLATQAPWKTLWASSCLDFAAQSQKGAAFPDRALLQICLAECSQDTQVSLITMIFHYAVPDTLDSAQA